MVLIDSKDNNSKSKIFCEDFVNTRSEDRFVFGINEYAEKIAQVIEIAGFIDDFTDNQSFMGKPVIKSKSIPRHAMVVSSLLGRPLTARALLNSVGVRNIDFFSFYTISGLISHPVRFWGDGKSDIEEYLSEYKKIFETLADQESKDTFKKIVNFRFTSNIDYLNGFCDRQKEQYFEPFLHLSNKNEVFVDVGGFEGETTQEFIRRCPEYKEIYIIEPDNINIQTAKLELKIRDNIHYLQYGASNRVGKARFNSSGSISSIKKDGDHDIQINTIDNLINSHVSYIKMDIEGIELDAIDGAVETISEFHPSMAIAVYHHPSDLRTIPSRILEIRDDYKIFMRHYTEGVVETIMYFVPHGK
ncbi:MAG: FkbM family methyltransferase [Candidatus Thiodiazotropha sp. (ex Lucina pensylvanica)]|nr:FkbM family methyltransferase [Candidatus Thiodiazotropha sp. (ex Lucina pensylvanica)]MBT3051063.1 FkbM family methyltransferase [Candidatus Thiodiazotropha sp. (ex Codakia orbicularis)]